MKITHRFSPKRAWTSVKAASHMRDAIPISSLRDFSVPKGSRQENQSLGKLWFLAPTFPTVDLQGKEKSPRCIEQTSWSLV